MPPANSKFYRSVDYQPPKRKSKLKKKKAIIAISVLLMIILMIIGINKILQTANDRRASVLPEVSETNNDMPEPVPAINNTDIQSNPALIDNSPPIIYNPENIELPYLIERLSFLSNPIPGSVLSWNDAHLPNAPRPYRNGYHQGIDFYPEGSGEFITEGTHVYSIAAGTVIRIDHNYTPLTVEKHQWLSEISLKKEQDTPEWVLDLFRGRQVWIDHGGGIISRYAHLHDVSFDLETGDYIETGQKVGTVGYSGTTSPQRPHLHLEIWLGNHYLGTGMSVFQIRELLIAILF